MLTDFDYAWANTVAGYTVSDTDAEVLLVDYKEWLKEHWHIPLDEEECDD